MLKNLEIHAQIEHKKNEPQKLEVRLISLADLYTQSLRVKPSAIKPWQTRYAMSLHREEAELLTISNTTSIS